MAFIEIVERMVLMLVYLSLLLFSLSRSYGLVLGGDRLCGETVEVNRTSGLDCSSNPQPQSGNVTCSSLSDALQLISQPPAPRASDPSAAAGGCVEVLISQGTYIVEGAVVLARDVYLRGRDGHTVSVVLLIPATDPPEFTYSLSFRNSQFAGIENIQFSGSNGVVGFDNVSAVDISHSSFR